MKKFFAILVLAFCITVLIIVVNFNEYQKNQRQVSNFNREFEEYNKEDVLGVDITTLINKAISNNEKYGVQKDENGLYIDDGKNSIQIYITMIINGQTYPMENINKLGIDSFTSYFGVIKFRCTNISYHEETSKIASMTFESTQY